MSKAVQFDEFGGVDVLHVSDVERPHAGSGEALVSVVVAGMNPGEIAIREGEMEQQFTSTFPSGQGTDFAGVIAELGDGADRFTVGQNVIGWTDQRGAQAEFVAVSTDHLVAKPDELDWEVAGGLFVVATTAMASVTAVDADVGDTVLVSGAGGGVGSLAAQLLVRRGAEVVAVAGESHHDWLRSIGTTPIVYGDGLRDSISEAAPSGVDALVDCAGDGYVDLGIEMGVAPSRINTIIDFSGAARHEGVHADGSATAADAMVLADVAQLAASGDVDIRVAEVYDLDHVVEAYTRLNEGHTGGKFVLRVSRA